MDLKKQGLRGLRHQAARAQAGIAEDTSVPVALSDIVVDEAIQVRQNGLDQDRVQQYALAMVEYRGWGEFPALVVFRDPETNALRLAGGFHRRSAVDVARQPLIEDGHPPIEVAPCEIRTGGYREAVEFAEDDNLTHGLDLTNKDRRAIYARRMSEGHVWAEYSNRRIAAELGVDERTVRRWYTDLTAANAAVERPDMRIGKDGRAINVGGIQDASRQRTQQDPESESAPPQDQRQGQQQDRQRYVEHDEAEPSGVWRDATPTQSSQAREPLADKLDELADHLIGAVNVLSEAIEQDGQVSEDAVASAVYVLNICNGHESGGEWYGGLLDLVEALIARGNE